MEKYFKTFVFLCVILLFAGCAHMAYLGMHGKSIRSYPDIHESVVKDEHCLECHHPDNPEGPVTPHPDFIGCIKCHND